MSIYIILFRGINVGGKNLLSMKDLKSLLEEDYESVKTYIQSGNVVLRAKSNPLKNISSKVETKFGLKPEIVALEKTEFENVVNANPYSSFEGKFVHFYFCTKKPHLDNKKLEALVDNGEAYQLRNDVFYLHAPNGIGRSKLVSNIESCLGGPATGRNLNTVLKLKELAQNI